MLKQLNKDMNTVQKSKGKKNKANQKKEKNKEVNEIRKSVQDMKMKFNNKKKLLKKTQTEMFGKLNNQWNETSVKIHGIDHVKYPTQALKNTLLFNMP